jgi:Flp pilus assembly protein TadD
MAMVPGDETVRAIREALELSPENVPLRRHLAETLAGLGRLDEAEREFREALSRAPDSQEIKTGLADV